MFDFGSLTFLAPWALGAAAVLPVLWWLLRVTPPTPRLVRFPAVRLLFGLTAREETPARTPWWLIVLRMVLAVLLILAVAHPVLDADRQALLRGPLLIVVDDGWSAARGWQRHQAAVRTLLDRAERARQPVMLLPTAAPADGGPLRATTLMSAAQARSVVQAMAPKPWPSDRKAAAEATRQIERADGMRIAWVSDGVSDAGAHELARRLQTLGLVEAFSDSVGALPRLLLPPALTGAELLPRLRRAFGGGAEGLWVRAADSEGRTLARQRGEFAPGAVETTARFDLPSELRNRIARLDIEDEASAGAVVLMDDRWRRRPVGLVEGEQSGTTPLLSDRYYPDKALAPFAELRRGSVAELLARDLSVLLLPDTARPTGEELGRIGGWVERGGMVVRFAGANLARSPDELLPVRLRPDTRTLGGAMSWTAPMPLAPFPAGSPFAGLAIPPDVQVMSQVLAQPEADLNDKTWARLVDGTPLVTAARRGKGWVVLVHTTSGPSWSNLPMSGLFVDMLRRLVATSDGVAGAESQARLAPLELLDGFGRLRPPLTGAVALAPADIVGTVPSPRHPPGLYGDHGDHAGGARRALNLGPAVTRLEPITFPSGVVTTSYDATKRERDLKPWLLLAALALAVLDFGVALALRGLFSPAALAALLLVSGGAPPAEAAEDDAFALKAALETRLAYVRTGNGATDQMSKAGLTGLSAVLGQRSTAVLGEPMGIDVEADPLLFFPLLYWPIDTAQPPPSSAAAQKLNDYLRHGGLILFDSRDGGDPGAGLASRHLQSLTADLAIPPLTPVPTDHVLTRSFYLLRDFPGRWSGGPVWVERGADQSNDGVSSVVVGGNDWASAWAVDNRGRPLVALVPGGEQQREMSYRFGVNLVMYALTGNYKGDQVHVPHILERLSR
jgi:hypothetical protein